jgi:hypothetical protein
MKHKAKPQDNVYGKCDRCGYVGPDVRGISKFYAELRRKPNEKICRKCWEKMN